MFDYQTARKTIETLRAIAVSYDTTFYGNPKTFSEGDAVSFLESLNLGFPIEGLNEAITQAIELANPETLVLSLRLENSSEFNRLVRSITPKGEDYVDIYTETLEEAWDVLENEYFLPEERSLESFIELVTYWANALAV